MSNGKRRDFVWFGRRVSERSGAFHHDAAKGAKRAGIMSVPI
jgi:hypothetical protein